MRKTKKDFTLQDYYSLDYTKNGFVLDLDNETYCSAGRTWTITNDMGKGTMWTYKQDSLFQINIHNFAFYEDQLLQFVLPDCMSITKYYDIDGEEYPSHRKLRPGCIKSFVGGKKEPYYIFIPKNHLIHSVGIEIFPAYYQGFLKSLSKKTYEAVIHSFISLDQPSSFPEMDVLLNEVANYRGDSISAQLFFHGKVAQALGLITEYQSNRTYLCPQDIKQMELVTAFIDQNYAQNITLTELEKIACMGTTKLQNTFHVFHKCTITSYIQKVRIQHGKELLVKSSYSINDIAQAVGYKKSGRFSELFKKSTGLTPLKFRKSHQQQNTN